ncbi:CDC42 small effector protein 2 [Anabarilius grahami]|uniref:CDC42 small effector protein 2 n=1 Tax=Anabarilius grahami TaxID=495550 RepID=A0A3N0Y7I5_ANAGA|nr:CDC42 small effector protein 2 [Anabarilius grahami]
MTEFWVCFSCCVAEQPQPVSQNTLNTRFSCYESRVRRERRLRSEPNPSLDAACLPVSRLIVLGVVCELQKRRRRIDRSMIGEPTNFVHMTHVGSGDMGMPAVNSVQAQMKSKGGYGNGTAESVQG